MSLVPLSPLQFRVIHLLFTGPKCSVELRRLLKKEKIRISQSAFSQLMTRLVWGKQIVREYVMRNVRGRNMRQCTFAATDYGVRVWNETRQFYLDLDPPAADFVPVSTEASRKAHLTPEQRNAELLPKLFADCPWLFRM